MLRRAGSRLLAQLAQTRGYAAEAAVAEAESPFMRFGSPFAPALNMSDALAQLPETKVTRLSNGLRVASETVPHSSTATVGVWIDAGSRYETDASNGTAHFLEHMAFKGTTSRTVRDLEVEIENMGGHLNAYTSREQTCYYAKVFEKDVPQALEILADILQNSNLDERAIERERDVILREMQEVEGIPEEVIFDHLHATAFQHSPLGRTILGPAENVRSISRQHLADYIATNYTAPRMVISAAGAVDHGALVAAAEKAFAKLPSAGKSAGDLVKEAPAVFTGSDVRIRDPDQPALQFAVAFKGASWTDPDSIPLMVMQTMLGAWDKNSGAGVDMASPLAQTVAANKLAHSYMAFNTNYHDTGLFGVYAVADPHTDHEDLAWSIMRNVTKLCYSVEDEDVARARNQLKASILFSQDGTTGIAEDIGRNLLVYGRRLPKAELFARIDAVDADTVKAVAQRFILDQDVAIAAMGDTQFLPDYTWMRRRTYWLRY
ncbi:putative mitochondrial-processing peptidase subunit beta [Micractinium conductrix]|uniref:mitochondrial processing peptidase n=1 Tax=Micractinium conductrix TaxID=554055 RepID=A0A2P6VNY7_9CHLO|nr:putative mitochondrial-processing peptidase subunit beta [Micractinium conductrix]|eukprot:PSC75779.1 putative mitochondrial-processing peptidase subunit beta [Micractinium conductrix]